MPIYEFYSPETHKIYSFFARSLAYASKTPRCPDKPGAPMERMVSKFAVTGRAKEKSDMPAGDDMDPRMERVMAEMERDMALNDAVTGQTEGTEKNAQAEALRASQAVQQVAPA